MAASPVGAPAGRMKRSPELRRLSGREMKVSRQHANDDVWSVIQCNRLPQYILFPAVPLLPGGVAQHHGARRGGKILSRVEIASKHRCDPQRAEEAITHTSSAHRLCA